MNPRPLLIGCSLSAICWVTVYAWLTNNGPLLILCVFAGLVWCWMVDIFSSRWTERPHLYDRDRERIGFDSSNDKDGAAEGLAPGARTTRR